MKQIESTILTGLTDEEKIRLESLAIKEIYDKGGVILKENTSAECFYIVEEGEVAISKNNITLATMTEGMHFGLMAMFDGSPRSADAVALSSTVLFNLPYTGLKDPKNNDLYQKILANQLTIQQKQLRLMNDFTVAEVGKKISERSRVESITAQSLYYESLLKEIHHRVKNNLQTVSSLLYLQSKSIADPDAKKAILSSQQRVDSMALIHKNLYQRENLADLEMRSYITQLTSTLVEAYKRDSQKISVKLEMEEVELNVEKAIPVGLIINELVTNSLKYAFEDRNQGVIKIQFSVSKNRVHKITVSDDGIGKKIETNDGFGTQLVKLLSKQIEGTFTESSGDGYGCVIEF
jgi:two-component sensor histidine kinase